MINEKSSNCNVRQNESRQEAEMGKNEPLHDAVSETVMELEPNEIRRKPRLAPSLSLWMAKVDKA